MKSRQIAVIGGLTVVVIIGGAFMVARGRYVNPVPDSFTQARLQGALVAQNIVDLSNQLNEDVKRINQYDQDRQFADAFALTGELIQRSRDIRAKAVDLSQELEKMAQALPAIKDPEAQDAALQSLTQRLAIIDRLINYSAYLSDLLDILRGRFAGQAQTQEVSALIDKVNSEVTAINNFNRNAVQSTERFDRLVQERR
ncbi:MAG: hypothetical protein HY978_02495 [Candidatus Liptonbacteria bacterium]|nr:hypothetical protein [Candidatus Liptonbacteria bacterium]